MVHGLDGDPLLAAPSDGANLAVSLADQPGAVLIARDLSGDGGDERLHAVEEAGFASAIAVPLRAQGRLLGLLTAYRDRDHQSLDDDDLELAAILGATAAMAYANVLAFRQLDENNTTLESTVEQRSMELKTTLEEVQRLNAELERMNLVKSELITRMADRLTAPIASLVTATQVLEGLRDAPWEKTSRLLAIVRSEADALSEIIDSVVQASRLARDSDGLARRDCRLQELLRDAISPLRDVAKKLEVDLKVLIPGGLETISCDPDALNTALRAVVKNGIEFNRRGGEVRIEVRRVVHGQRPWVEFRIADTGPGIDAADIGYVFEVFWQGESGSERKRRGLGLGLAIAKQVAEGHGGRIAVARGDAEEGTRVTMVVPQ